MSEPRLIEPLLADHIIGQPISDHDGVRCCPAMHKESEEKYIVKILSIPANEKQLDALLLSGACHSKEDAQRYFRELAEEAVSEAELLQKLSRLEGFQSFDSWQIEPMEDGTGFDVYLLAPYGQTLERHLRRNTLTHLSAVNLGLDLCAALSVCRRNGWLYVDLKPENIFLTDSHGFLIGDLGFVRLSSLKYASLPDKYRSVYTAPEIEDAYSALNSTLDIYAAGLILYQVYNNGVLPQPGEPIVPPEYADYEMSEIILKACAYDPNDRWQDPQEMGQALVGYMQRNTINDDPIIPPVLPTEPEEDVDEETVVVEAETTVSSDESLETEAPTEEPAPADAADLPTVDIPDTASESPSSPEETPADAPVVIEPEVFEEEPEEMEQIVIEGFLFDDLQEDVDLSDLTDAELSDEVTQMLAQADELINHKAPDPVVAPEAIDVPMPDPILPEPEPELPGEPEEPEIVIEPAQTDEEAPESDTEDEDVPSTETEEPVSHKKPKRRRKLGWIALILVVLLLIAGTGFGVKYYYENEYLQHIASVDLEHAQDWVTVTLDTRIDNSLLTVTCTDTYGNKLTQPVVNNQAAFTSLHSGTTYKIAVTISGKHQLTGATTATFSTPQKTSIVGFAGITGDSNGSVILNFSVQGPDASGWLVKYSTEAEQELTASCTGHMALITGLTPGKTYTFRLVPQNDLYVVGGDTLQFTASNVICAQDLTIHGFEGGVLTASWSVPDGETVQSWTVRCFNSNGVDLTFTVTEPYISIEGLDITQGYTLDVLASGMTVSKWTSISAGSISFKDILIDDSVSDQLTVTWNYEGTVPEGGWNVVYTVDGSAPILVNSSQNAFTVTSLIPGAHYAFDFQLPSGISIFGTTSAAWDAPEAEKFTGYGVSADHMLIRMCLNPLFDDWSWDDIAPESYTTQFSITDQAAFVLQLVEEYETSPDLVTATFLIRDQSGSLVSVHDSAQSWTSMWYEGYCELPLPALPSAVGAYTVEIYLNGAYITSAPISFTVV